MLCVLKVLLFLIFASICSCLNYDGLRAKFAYTSDQAGKENFFSIPRSVGEAQSQGWRRVVRPAGPMPELNMYCYPRRIVCVLYAATGFVAGLQVAFPVTAVDPSLRPERYFSRWNPPATEDEPSGDYWTATQFYVTEDFLKAGGPTAASGSTLQDDGVWVNDLNGRLMKIPLNENEIKPPFGKTVCIPNMGLHYYYNVSRQFDCSNVIFPWFATYTDGQLQDVGFQTIGTNPVVPDGERNWFEFIPQERSAVLFSRPNAPDCMMDLHARYGSLSLHIYYIDKPWEIIKCPSDQPRHDKMTLAVNNDLR